MIPSDYFVFFATLAAVEATLFGLIFIVISIVPETVLSENAPINRQVKVITAYTALINPLFISLFALIPHQQIGLIVMIWGGLGAVNTIEMTRRLLMNFGHTAQVFRLSLFTLAGFVLYGYEIYCGLRLFQNPADTVALYVIADILIFIAFFGVIRAWELIGIRPFHLLDRFSTSKTSDK